MPDVDFLTRHGASLGGVVAAALLKFRDGWRIMLVYGVVGSVAVISARGLIEYVARKFDGPVDVAGFVIGALACSLLSKVADTVQQIEIARPINGFIERWLGAKAPTPKE